MNLIVMKFGGTSVSNIDNIYNVANIVEKESKSNKIIVVLSAMAGVTNQLQDYLESIDSEPSPENYLVLTSGEQVSVGLLSAILKKKGILSIPLLGWQIPIITDEYHEKAKILNIDKKNIDSYFKKVDVIVLAGYQGINSEGTACELVGTEGYAVAQRSMQQLANTADRIADVAYRHEANKLETEASFDAKHDPIKWQDKFLIEDEDGDFKITEMYEDESEGKLLYTFKSPVSNEMLPVGKIYNTAYNKEREPIFEVRATELLLNCY